MYARAHFFRGKEMAALKKILLLDGEDTIRSFAAMTLRRAGYHPIECASASRALDDLRINPDLRVLLLEAQLEDTDAFALVRRIRKENSRIGIIFLSSRSAEMDKISGLAAGADDYVTKPFSPQELIARIDALCRRVAPADEPDENGCILHGPFRLNTRTRVLEKNGLRIRLTQIEYALMQLFMTHPGTALSRGEILSRVWGEGYFGEEKVVDVNVRRLRIKIEDEPTEPEFITTVWGYGYKWGF